MNSRDAHRALTDALANTIPDCHEDDRYVTDLLHPIEQRIMAEICAACPLLDPCSNYARAAKPPGGWWPGHQLKITSGRQTK